MSISSAGYQANYDRVLAHELFALIVPGYLITAYLVAPFFEDIFPPFIKRRLLRSSRLFRPSAERKLRCSDFSVEWRYSDLLTNTTICLSLLCFTSPNMWKIMLWLLASVALLSMIDHYRLLRQTTLTFHTTERLSMGFSYWWS